MPPRKSTASVGMSPDETTATLQRAVRMETRSPTAPKADRQSISGDADGEKTAEKKKPAKNDEMGVDDLLLPRTLTSRLSRGTLPPNTSIQRDALLALTKSATVFISYLAHTANTLTSRKTIQSQDILEALRETELWNVNIHGSMTLGERVRAEVDRWEGEVKGKRKGYRDRVKARESGTGTVTGDTDVSRLDGELQDEDEDEDSGRGPQAKRIRRSSGDGRNMDVEGTQHGSTGMEGDDEEEEDFDPAARQLQEEEAATNGDGDATETDPEAEDEEGDDMDEEEDDEVEDDGDEDSDAHSPRETDPDLDADGDDGRPRTALAPNGRVEIGSDEESD